MRGKPGWDEAAGFSFWVKGDGSDHFGGLQFIYDEDYAVRYDYMFPIKSTEWTKVTVAWSDLVPVMPGPKSVPLGPGGNSRRSCRDSGSASGGTGATTRPRSFAIDELRLEKKIDRDAQRLSSRPVRRWRGRWPS